MLVTVIIGLFFRSFRRTTRLLWNGDPRRSTHYAYVLLTLRPLYSFSMSPCSAWLKRRKKQAEPRLPSPSLDWTVLSISPSLPPSLSGYGPPSSLAWLLNEALMRDILTVTPGECDSLLTLLSAHCRTSYQQLISAVVWVWSNASILPTGR